MTSAQLFEHIQHKKSFLCVGLDTDVAKLPSHILGEQEPLYAFNKAIIDATASYAVAYKLNLAFYEAVGARGWEQLEKTVHYIRLQYPDIFIIADAKRGDIGNTSELYAKAFFEILNVDAVTLSPYMGSDTVRPFLRFDHKWAIILALTSNSSAADFELTEEAGSEKKLYEKVIEVSSKWGNKDNMMYVIGATQADTLKSIRQIIPEHFILVPGIGAQGGSLDEVAKYGMNNHCGLLVNSSRAIIFAGEGKDFAIAAEKEAQKIQQEMKQLLIQYC